MKLRQSAAIALVSLLPVIAEGKAPPKAFEDRAISATPVPPERGERRSRAVRVRTNLFDVHAATLFQIQKPESKTALPDVAMNFFSGTVLRVRWTTAKVDPVTATVEWTGSIDSAPLGSAVLIVNGQRFTGNFSRGDGITYQVRTDANRVVRVREIHQSAFPAERAPRTPAQ